MIALAQFRAIRPGHQRQMAILRLRKTEQPLQIYLAGRRGEQIFSAHHLVHPGQIIIDNNRQLIGKLPIAASQNKIPGNSRKPLTDTSPAQIGKADFLIRHPDPPGTDR